MASGYNHMFDKLVEDDNDFVGMVAYTRYKRQKVEWLKKFEADHGRAATDDDVTQGFSAFCGMESQISAYREQAIDLIDNFLDIALNEQIEEIGAEMHKDAIVQAVKRPFWLSVADNVTAGLVASLVTMGAAGLVWVAAKGPENLLRQALDHYLPPASPPSAAPPASAQ